MVSEADHYAQRKAHQHADHGDGLIDGMPPRPPPEPKNDDAQGHKSDETEHHDDAVDNRLHICRAVDMSYQPRPIRPEFPIRTRRLGGTAGPIHVDLENAVLFVELDALLNVVGRKTLVGSVVEVRLIFPPWPWNEGQFRQLVHLPTKSISFLLIVVPGIRSTWISPWYWGS